MEGKTFLKICFISYLSFKNNTSLSQVTHFYYLQFVFYSCFVRAVIEKCLLNICFFKLSKALEKYL